MQNFGLMMLVLCAERNMAKDVGRIPCFGKIKDRGEVTRQI